jgi:hypothetical protein
LELRITDANGDLIGDLPDHELTLRLQVYSIRDTDKEEMYENIKEIADTIKDLFIMKSLKNPNR